MILHVTQSIVPHCVLVSINSQLCVRLDFSDMNLIHTHTQLFNFFNASQTDPSQITQIHEDEINDYLE